MAYLHWLMERLGQDDRWHTVRDKHYCEVKCAYASTPSPHQRLMDGAYEKADVLGCDPSAPRMRWDGVLYKHTPPHMSPYAQKYWDASRDAQHCVVLHMTQELLESVERALPQWSQDVQQVLQEADSVIPDLGPDSFGEFPDLDGTESFHSKLQRQEIFNQLRPLHEGWRLILIYSSL